MQVVLVTESLNTGGAETFILRLGAALQATGASVSIFVLRGDLINKEMVRRISPDIPLLVVNLPFLPLWLKLDGALFRMGFSFSLMRWIHAQQLKAHLRSVEADIVHSHLLTADLVAARSCANLNIPYVSTMHGDYLALEAKGRSRAARIWNFYAALREIEPSVAHMVCITEQQKAQLSRLMPSLAKKDRISKIYNGYAASVGDLSNGDEPEVLRGLPDDAFVVGMVARGVRDKGWDVLIAAFKALDLPNAWLVLVGDGDYLQQIRPGSQHPRILFCGNVVDPLRYIAHFDVACLPTQFSTESLPTVVIEYMYLGKPVIATSVGEIPNMLEAKSDAPAGLLIDLAETPAMAEQMQAALLRLYENKAERKILGINALKAVKKFDMDACVAAYLDVYARALS